MLDTPSKRAIALLANDDGIQIATSPNGRVWSIETTACISFFSFDYHEEVTNGNEPIWQVECSEPRGILIIKPQSNSTLFFNLNDTMVVSDAILMDDNTLYLLNKNSKLAEVYKGSIVNGKLQVVGQFNPYFQWELTNDSRSAGVLIVKDGNTVQGSFYPQEADPIIIYGMCQ
jgi:hypothetical protein